MNWYSPAQCVGYIAFILGVATFLQRQDRKLKIYNAAECLAYVVHFIMLGNTAAASSLISLFRSLTSLKFNSRWLAGVFIALNLIAGYWLVKSPAGWLPVVGSCLATYGMFTMKGIPMRIFMLMSTACWLSNNILCGSIGGTMLETSIAIVSIYTLVRMSLAARHGDDTPAAEPACGD